MNTSATLDGQSNDAKSALRHLRYIDGLRGLTAMYVVMSHIFGQYGGSDWRIFLHGRFAVIFFIVISGFCLTLDSEKRAGTGETYASYLRRRAVRILPPYYGGIAFTLLMIALFVGEDRGTHWAISLPVTKASLLQSILLVQDFGSLPSTINHAYWFMPILFQLYIVFPLLARIARRIGAAPFFCGSVALAIFPIVFGSEIRTVATATNLSGIFCMGIAAAVFVLSKKSDGAYFARLADGGGMLACLAGYFVLVFLAEPNVNSYPLCVASALVCSLLLVTYVRGNDLAKRTLEARPVVFLGVLSYSIYLIHAPLIEFVDIYAVQPLVKSGVPAMPVLLSLSLPLSLLAAYVFHRFVEIPGSKMLAAATNR